MAIYLDYSRRKEDGEIFIIIIREDNGMQHTFYENELDRSIIKLLEPGHIVVFERPVYPLAQLFENYPNLEVNPIRPRWFDIFTILRSETLKEPALSKVALATLGYGPQSDIVDLPKIASNEPTYELEQKMHDRLKIIAQLYQVADFTGRLSFFHKDTNYMVEVDVIEPTLPD